MTHYDFDKVVDRSGSGALKWEVLQERYGRSDLLPLWVADLDFETPDFISKALRRRLDHSLYGYTVTPPSYWEAICQWQQKRNKWHVERDWMCYIPGIVKGIGMAIQVFTQPGDKVIVQPPVYHPFHLTPRGNGREVVWNPLRRDGDRYYMDFKQLEEVIDDRCRLLILSNPHNPAGIVWTPEELRQLAEICDRHHIVVISDEIHADLTLFGHHHHPFASVSDRAARCSITFAAPSKSFNIAGIVSSYAIVPNDSLRRRFFSWLDANELADPPLFAPIATEAAYRHGEVWLEEMLAYVEQNILFVEEFCRERIPAIHPLRPEASFLVWLDCRALGLDHEALIDLFVNQAHLALNDGEMFGPGGTGYMRLNVGTQRSRLRQALEQLEEALKNHDTKR